jgi:mannitol/fructose-specific phosphotransferase system IIA component (Ntr-type)
VTSDAAERFGYPLVELPPAALESPEAAVRFLVEHLVRLGRIDAKHAADVCSHVLHRESLGSTAIGGGFALPHSKSEFVSQVCGIIGHTAAPMQWSGSMDSKPVHTICLLVTPAAEPGAGLRALQDLCRRLHGG